MPKNGKTFVVAVLFILLFLLEPPFSRFFSVAPDGDLAREIKALDPLISVNDEALAGDLDVGATGYGASVARRNTSR